MNSQASIRHSYNKLSFHNNNLLEKYSLSNFESSCPGLKPLTNWPVSLEDLINKLNSTSIEEIFHQPFDSHKEFHNGAISFIETYFEKLLNEFSPEYKVTYEDYIYKACTCLLTVKILEGDFSRFYEVLIFFKKLNNKNSEFFSNILHKVMQDNLVKSKLKSLLKIYKENNNSLYPIMRNYSINDFYCIKKNILFAPLSFTSGRFGSSVSLATDSIFLYIILSGVNGGLIKVGTGNGGTEKGKVYLMKNLPKSNNDILCEESTHHWVHHKGKLYMKTVSPNNNDVNHIGQLTILNCETLEVEDSTRLLIPENAKHPILRKKNENYPLLSDGESLVIVLMEPVTKESSSYRFNEKYDEYNLECEDESLSPIENEISSNQGIQKDLLKLKKMNKHVMRAQSEATYPPDVFSNINLVTYSFSLEKKEMKNKSDQSQTETKLIDEIYEAFSHLFSIEECRKALIFNNWDPSKTANYLVENEDQIKKQVIVPNQSCLLISTKIESIYYKNLRSEFRIRNNSIFDVTQFDLLKWAVCKDLLMAYKLKEGACAIFSRNSEEIKEFKYSYTEKTGAPSYNTFNESSGNNLPSYLAPTLLNNEKDFSFPNYLKPGTTYIGPSYGITSNFEEFPSPEKNIIKSKYKDYLKSFEDSRRDANKEIKPTKSKVKLEMKGSFAEEQFQFKDSKDNLFGNPFNHLIQSQSSTEKSSDINKFKSSANAFENMNLLMINNPMYNGELTELASESLYNQSSNLDNILEEERLQHKKNKKEVLKELKDSMRGLQDSSNKNERKEEISKKIKFIQAKISQSSKENYLTNKDLNNKDLNNPFMIREKEREDQEKVVDDIVKGSYLKVIPCIHLAKYDYVFCYDPIISCYYLVNNSCLSSISIQVSTTFLDREKEDKFLLANEEEKSLKFLNENRFDNFQEFYDNFLSMLLIMQSKIPDSYWKYKNWNFFYCNLAFNLNSKLSHDNFYNTYNSDYSLPLLNNSTAYTNQITKILTNKIEKSTEYNEEIIKQQLPECLRGSIQNGSLKSETKKLSYGFSGQLNGSFGKWDSAASLNISGDGKVLNELDYKIIIENYRLFYFGIEGNSHTLKLLLEELNYYFAKLDFKNVHTVLFMIFYLIVNCNNFDGIKRKNQLSLTLQLLKEKLLEIYKKISVETLEELKIMNFIYRIIIAGWDLLFPDILSKSEMFQFIFKEYLNFYLKNYDIEEKSSQNLELNILQLDVRSIENNPFKILLKKLSMKSSLNLAYNFEKINVIKCYDLSLKKNSKFEKGNFSVNSSFISLNPKNTSLPFYWILLGFKFKTRSDIIQENTNNDMVQGKTTLQSILSNQIENNNISSDEESNDTDKPKLSKVIDVSSWNYEESENQYSLFKDTKEKYKNSFGKYQNLPSTLFKSEENIFNKSNSFKNKSSLLTSSKFREPDIFQELNKSLNEEDFHKTSEEFWSFLENEILKNDLNSQKFLSLLHDFFLLNLGDLGEYSTFNIQIEKIDPENGFFKNCQKFIIKNFLFVTKLHKNIADLSKIKDNILLYSFDVIASIFSKIKHSPISSLKDLQLTLSSLGQLLSTTSNIRLLSNVGVQLESEKKYEYSLSNEVTPIMEKITFKKANCLLVNLEFKANKDRQGNYDIIVVSNEHDYSNTKYITNNNFKNYGTCFLLKLNGTTSKTFFLQGDEIKIISPSDLELNMKLGRKEIGKYYGTKISIPNSSNEKKSKSSIIIKVYPFTSQFKYLSDYILTDFESSKLDLIRQIDYYSTFINKYLLTSIKASNYITCEDKNENHLLSLGLNKYNYSSTNIGNMTLNEITSYIKKNSNKNIESNKGLQRLEIQDYSFPQIYEKEIESILGKIGILKGFQEVQSENLFSSRILENIRKIVKEPTDYSSIKMLSSFANDKELKLTWQLFQNLFILTLIHHLGLHEEIETEIDNSKKLYLEFVGKKLNTMMIWMSNKVKRLKDTYDNLKSYLLDIIETHNSYFDNLKKQIIDKVIQETDRKHTNVKVKDSSLISKMPEKKLESTNNFKNTTKSFNFKKKQNVKRLYTDINKKKKTKTKDIKHEDQDLHNHNCNESFIFEDLNTKSLDFLLSNYSIIASSFVNFDDIKKLKEEMRNNIIQDLKNSLFGNADKLKVVCEVNNLKFDENNLSDSLKLYTDFILKKLNQYYNFDEIVKFGRLEEENILEVLHKDSPYYNVATQIIKKNLFLLSLRSSSKNKLVGTYLNNSNHNNLELSRESSFKKKNQEEDVLISFESQQVLKGIFSFLYRNYKEGECQQNLACLKSEFLRISIRSFGITNLSAYILDNEILSSTFLTLLGGINSSVEGDLLNQCTTVSHLKILNPEQVESVMQFYINLFNKILENQDSFIRDQNIELLSNEYLSFKNKNLKLILADLHVLINFFKKSEYYFSFSQNMEKFIRLLIDFMFENKSIGDKSNESKSKSCESKQNGENYELSLLLLSNLASYNSVIRKASELTVSLSDEILENLYKNLETSSNEEEKIIGVLNLMDSISSHITDVNIQEKISEKLLSIILNSKTYETIVLASKISRKILNSTNCSPNSIKFFSAIMEKIGKLFMIESLFMNNQTSTVTASSNQVNQSFYVVVQMNSPELDYQFLINALFYWEEKYPTKLSLYKYISETEWTSVDKMKEKEKDLLTINGLNINPELTANININNSGQKIKMYNYFNPIKSKTTKMSLFEKIADERITNIKKAIEEGTKMLNNLQNNQASSTSSTPEFTSRNLEESLKERLHKLRIQEAYQNRIKAHIKLAEQIGETAATRGFVSLEPALPKILAEELSEVIHKAFNHLLPHFKANIEESVTLFSDEMIYPKMPEKDLLLAGCTNTLKETTRSFMNVTLFRKDSYETFEKLLKNYTDNLKTLAQTTGYVEEKRGKIGYYNNNYLLGYNYSLISKLDFNQDGKVIEAQGLSGTAVTMILEMLLTLIRESHAENIDLGELKKLKDWFRNDYSCRMKIIGLMLLLSNFYKCLRKDSKGYLKNNPEGIFKILSGGEKSGKPFSHVFFLKDKKVKVEKIINKDIIKLKDKRFSEKLGMTTEFAIDLLIDSYEIYLKEKDNIEHKLLLHLSLKILLELEGKFSEENMSLQADKLTKFLRILQNISSEIPWLEKEEDFWESEFIEAMERLYNRIDHNAEKIYSPVFDVEMYLKSSNFHPLSPITQEQDLITKYTLPSSNYIKRLPKISDLSKLTTSLRNITNFDRYLVGEIYQYNSKQWREDDFVNAFYQIRNYLSIGDITNAYADLNQILDGAKIPSYMFPPRDSFDTTITKEECYPGHYYGLRLNSKLINKIGIKSLFRLYQIGIPEATVLLLLHDNTINQALVAYWDNDKGKIYSFWTPIDSMQFLENQIKTPANSFKSEDLERDYKFIEKRLRIFYAKKILTKVMSLLVSNNSVNNFNELINFIFLTNWQIYSQNPIAGPFRNFKNYILTSHIEFSNKECRNDSPLMKMKSSDLKDSGSCIQSENIDYFLKLGNTSSSEKTLNSHTNSQLETILPKLCIESTLANEAILNFCMKSWQELEKSFIKIKTDLFHEYNVNYNESLKSDKVFKLGNFSNKLLSLHELTSMSSSNFAGIVLTFEKEAYLGPNAKLSFYSDPYGENLIHQIVSIKTSKYNLESVVFDYNKVWMVYTPGTRAFSIFEWYIVSRDSHLPCSIVFVPQSWPTLVILTDYCSSALFNDVNKDSLRVFGRIIRALMQHCTSLSLPAEIQRKIFNLTNRAVLKASKYLSLLNSQKVLSMSMLSINERFNIIGIDEFMVTQLINNINTFNLTQIQIDSQTVNNFSSAYIVEGVEVIISILSVIKSEYNELDFYLRETFNFSLPVWIEAVMKLGQFLNFFQGSSTLEGSLMKEIYDQLTLDNNWEKIIIVENLPLISNELIFSEVKKLLTLTSTKIVDFNKDLHILENPTNKTLVILCDGFKIESLNPSSESQVKEEVEDPFWECYYCGNENDKENSFCIFCDKNKKIKPKPVKKATTQSSLIKVDSYLKSVCEKMKALTGYIKSSEILTTNEEEIEEKKIIKKYELSILCSDEISSVLSNLNKENHLRIREILNKFFTLRMKAYVDESDYFSEKLRILEANKSIFKYIANEVEVLKKIFEKPDEVIDYVKILTSLQNNGVDFWFEQVVLDSQSRKEELNLKLMEKLRELVDLKICKEKNLSLVLPPTTLRFVPENFESFNHTTIQILESYYKEIREVPLSYLRFYWAIIKYFNNCLVAALPFIKPPDTYQNDSEYLDNNLTKISFPKTISAFLSFARGLTISHSKLNLIKEVIAATEFCEEEVQIPTFKFERLNNTGNNVQSMYIFLKAYDQAKDVDPAFFRCKKVPGDPHIAFKIEFKGELVQGIGGPYRQFFSDISAELQKSSQDPNCLRLLIPTANALEGKGEFKDRWTINCSYNSNTAKSHYEFLGLLMGVCIRTGVHLTLDLCSLVWKKIVKSY